MSLARIMRVAGATLLLLVLVGTLTAADWPQWLGPKRNGGTSEKVEPWKEKPEIVWRASVGQGFSSPVVAAGRVFMHARGPDKEKEEETVVAFDAATGKELWKDTYERPAYKSVLGTGPRAKPTVAGKRLFTLGINGLLGCYEVDTGKRLWQVDLYKQFQADLPQFAVCCSPLVIGNRVIVSIGGKGRCVVALNVENGKVEWQALDDAASTSSAILFAGGARPRGGAPDAVFMTPLRIVGLDPLDGSLRWEHPMVFQPQGTSPTPVVIGDKIVASTQAHGAVAVQVGKKDEGLAASPAWQLKEAKSYFSSGVTAGDWVVLVTNTAQPIPEAYLDCLEAKTGKELWKKKVGYFHAGVIRTGDDKLLVLSDNGELTLWEIEGQGPKELAKAKVCDGTLVTPALAEGRLYVRDGKGIACVQLK
jgi:outer membrane protein assembly factor BamB